MKKTFCGTKKVLCSWSVIALALCTWVVMVIICYFVPTAHADEAAVIEPSFWRHQDARIVRAATVFPMAHASSIALSPALTRGFLVLDSAYQRWLLDRQTETRHVTTALEAVKDVYDSFSSVTLKDRFTLEPNVDFVKYPRKNDATQGTSSVVHLGMKGKVNF